MKLRQVSEELVKNIFILENLDTTKTIEAYKRISILKRYSLITNDIEDILNSLRIKGNKAAHGTYGTVEMADTLISLSVKLGAWFQEIYDTHFNFNAETVVYKKPENIDYAKRYEELVKITDKKEKELEDVLGALNNDATIYSKGINLPDGVILYKNVEEGEYKVPFIFSSNGREYNKDLPEKSGILFKDLGDLYEGLLEKCLRKEIWCRTVLYSSCVNRFYS